MRSIRGCASSARSRIDRRGPVSPVAHIRGWHAEFAALRRDLHMHPELGFEEHRTAKVVGERLAALGIEHHAGIGRTGVVAVVPGRSTASGRAIGLRADMDALPMQEENDVRAQVPLRRADARLRPRRPHDDAARRCALSPRDPKLRRHRVPDLPAGRGGLRRREGDDRGRPLRALPGRAGVRAAQLARSPAGAHRHHAGAGDGRRRPDRDHDRRQGRPRRASARGHRSGAGRRSHHHRRAVDREPQREPDRHCGRKPLRDAGRKPGCDERDSVARQACRHRPHVPACRRRT